MGAEIQKHEAHSSFGLLGDALHGVVETGAGIVHIVKLIGHDAIALARRQELQDVSRLHHE